MIFIHISAYINAGAEVLPLSFFEALDAELCICFQAEGQGKERNQFISPVHQGTGNYSLISLGQVVFHHFQPESLVSLFGVRRICGEPEIVIGIHEKISKLIPKIPSQCGRSGAGSAIDVDNFFRHKRVSFL